MISGEFVVFDLAGCEDVDENDSESSVDMVSVPLYRALGTLKIDDACVDRYELLDIEAFGDLLARGLIGLDVTSLVIPALALVDAGTSGLVPFGFGLIGLTFDKSERGIMLLTLCTTVSFQVLGGWFPDIFRSSRMIIFINLRSAKYWRVRHAVEPGSSA